MVIKVFFLSFFVFSLRSQSGTNGSVFSVQMEKKYRFEAPSPSPPVRHITPSAAAGQTLTHTHTHTHTHTPTHQAHSDPQD